MDSSPHALSQDEKNKQLLNAVEIGDFLMVASLLSVGASAEATGRFGYTALMLAARRGHSAVVAELITVGSHIDATSEYGHTALMLAARKGHSAVVSKLIEVGANKEATGQFGYTALMWAARNGHTVVVEKLIEAGVNKEATSRYRDTALIIAARSGHTAVVEKLIEAGANKEATSRFGCTALMHATRGNHEITAFLLLSAMSLESRAVLKFGQGGCEINRRLGQHPSARLAVRYEVMASGFERQIGEIYEFFRQSSRSMPNSLLGIMFEYLRPDGLLAVNMESKIRLASSITTQNQESVERAAVPVTFRAFSCFPSCLRSSESVMTKKKARL